MIRDRHVSQNFPESRCPPLRSFPSFIQPLHIGHVFSSHKEKKAKSGTLRGKGTHCRSCSEAVSNLALIMAHLKINAKPENVLKV